MTAKQSFSCGGWRGRAALEHQGDFQQLDQWLHSPPGECVVWYPCREVRRLQLSDGSVAYAKIIRALTDAGLERKEWFSWCKWVFRPSRAIATWRISLRLLAHGFLCPRPLLAARRRERGYPTDIFIAAEVPFPDLWHDDTLPPAQLADFVGRELAAFHEAGFAHGDCILRNLCREPHRDRLIYLDNDRTWAPPCFVRRHYQMRNLAQMAYSFLKRFEDTAISESFLNAYRGTGKGISLSDNNIAKILSGAIRRKNRNRKS
ncbi:MAG: hypothetical protein J6S21_07165 [Victivallales bacterium]|nr:hypothetical protein [Victivallales bacterium]